MAAAAYIVPAVASIVGAGIQSSSQKNAAKRQATANQQALALERERDAEERRRYDQQVAMYNQAAAAREHIRRQILRRHGYDVPEPAAAVDPSVKSLAPRPAATSAPAAGGMSLGSLMGGADSRTMFDSQGGSPSTLMAAPTAAPQDEALIPRDGKTLGDFSGWSDWRRYAAQ